MSRCRVLLAVLGLYLVFAVTKLGLVLSREGHLTSTENKNFANKGFLLTLTYAGQQIAGLRSLLSQRCWATTHKIPAHLVEPFVRNSRLIHSGNVWEDNLAGYGVKRLSDYYKMDYYYNQTGVTQIVSWERFLQEAPRKVIFVNINDIEVKNCPIFKPEGCLFKSSANAMEHQSNCTNTGKFDDTILYLKRYGFKVVQTLCLRCVSKSGFTHQTLYSQLYSKYHPQTVTVIFNQWKFHMRSELACTDQPPWCSTDLMTSAGSLQFSTQLQMYAESYINSVIRSNMFIAIMFRFEWYLITFHHNYDTADCLRNIETVCNEYTSQLYAAFVTTDIGKYGSATVNDTLAKFGGKIDISDVMIQIETVLNRTFHNIWRLEDVNRLWENIDKDVGYIAALHGAIALKSSCLFLFGGGHFQKVVLQIYLNAHRGEAAQCVKLMCVSKNFSAMFSKMISQALK